MPHPFAALPCKTSANHPNQRNTTAMKSIIPLTAVCVAALSLMTAVPAEAGGNRHRHYGGGYRHYGHARYVHRPNYYSSYRSYHRPRYYHRPSYYYSSYRPYYYSYPRRSYYYPRYYSYGYPSYGVTLSFGGPGYYHCR